MFAVRASGALGGEPELWSASKATHGRVGTSRPSGESPAWVHAAAERFSLLAEGRPWRREGDRAGSTQSGSMMRSSNPATGFISVAWVEGRTMYGGFAQRSPGSPELMWIVAFRSRSGDPTESYLLEKPDVNAVAEGDWRRRVIERALSTDPA